MNFVLLESSSPLMEQMDMFHDHAMLILLLILSFLTMTFFFMLNNFKLNNLILKNEALETIWTSLPVFILLFLAIPSISVLFLMEELIRPLLTIKIIGNQWFWTYEYSDMAKLKFDHFKGKKMYWMFESLELSKVKFDSSIIKTPVFRLLNTDKALILPIFTQIRLLITSNDVIHSWTLPSMGLKIDANPGRLNMGSLYGFRSGISYGQCSEICGVDHSFMPIKVMFCSKSWFQNMFK